jgi:GMP synthase-like glutamine amidotransferase
MRRMTERKVVVVQHVPYEGPGLIAELAARRGVELALRCVFAGARLPQAGELGALVLMGGPMGVHDSAEHPHLAAELELIAAAVADGTPILGVCLGAQLLAHALGGRVYPGERAEIGAGYVSLTRDGRADPVIGRAGADVLPVFHWHGETFDLPEGAVWLARSEAYPHQAFRCGQAYGLQFHVEVSRDLADGWRSHLPAGVEIPEPRRLAIEAAGRSILEAFLDLACCAAAG